MTRENIKTSSLTKKRLSLTLSTAIEIFYFILYKIYIYKLAGFDYQVFTDKSRNYAERFKIAVNYIETSHPLSLSGLTSWTPTEEALLDPAKPYYYTHGIEHYAGMLGINHIGGWDLVKELYPYLDETILFIIAWSISYLTVDILFKRQRMSEKLVLNLIIFALVLSTPWLTQGATELWTDNAAIALLLLSYLGFSKGKNKLAIILLTASALQNYVYSFFLSLYYSSHLLSARLSKQHRSKKNLERFPFRANDNPKEAESLAKSIDWKFTYLSIIGIIPVALLKLRLKLAESLIPGVTFGNSSLAWRSGFDGNKHMAGILGSFKFFSGTTNSGCSSGAACELLSLSTISLTILSVTGLFLLIKRKKSQSSIKKIVLPYLFIVLSPALFFQQSFWVHPYGYGIAYIFIYTLGISYIIRKIAGFITPDCKLLGIIFVSLAIMINNTAVSVQWLTHIADHIAKR